MMQTAMDLVTPTRRRAFGLLIALALSALFAALVLLPIDEATDIDRLMVVATAIVASTLGWLFAHRATKSGWRWALTTAILFDAMIGLVLIGVPMFAIGFPLTLVWVVGVRLLVRVTQRMPEAAV